MPPSSVSPAATPGLRLRVVGFAGELWNGTVRSVGLPGSAGRFGILAGHLPMLSTLREGRIDIVTSDDQRIEIYVSGGHVEVQPDAVTVVADLAARSHTLDEGRAAAARAAAAAPLAEDFTDASYTQLHLELMQRYHSLLRRR